MDKKILQTEILEKSYQPEKWNDVLTQYFSAKKFHQIPKSIILPTNDLAEMAAEIGSFYTADERLIGIYEVKLTPKAWIDKNRVGLRNLLRQVYKYDVDGALIVFVQNEKWRFSYVSEIRTEEGKKETEPKRYTYLFGKGESCRTAADRFDKLKGKPIYLSDLFDAFSVEKLNKDFFKSYKEYFESFSDHLAKQSIYRKLFLGSQKELEKGWKDEHAKPIRDFIKKLLGRIVFLQFLQKKGWMGVPSVNTDWIGGDIKFLQNLFLANSDQTHFHSKALRTLFFETLNSKRTNQLAPAVIGKNIKIPYLNGGLFDKDISYENDIDFPIELFKNLLDFFEQYNFTIDENDPYDSEVGIDPEMLGHIFENLLEENREKGAFYTPKEIVHYMCQESLIQYLRTHLPECTEDESPATKTLENFIRSGFTGDRNDKKNFIVQQAKRIEKLLDNVKICDPAIGSGAFPMGMLQEIFKAKTALDLTLDHAEVKKQIIQNCIYGVDIENGAVDIARLRFWLALVVDETEPHPLPNLDYKIMQGNSLLEQFEDISLKFERKAFEVKIIKEVDLFGKAINPQYTINEYLQTKQHTKEFDITELEEKYFNSNNSEEKQQIREKIENFEKQFILEQLEEREKQLKGLLKLKETDFNKDLNTVRENQAEYLHKGKKAKDIEKQKIELEKIKELRKLITEIKQGEKPWFLWHLYFMDVFAKGGFDIVIGNPPYIQIQKMGKDADLLELANYVTFARTGDIYCLFYEQGNKLLKSKGNLCYITSNSWLKTKYGKQLRKYLATQTNPVKLLNFEDTKLFQNAVVETNILITNKTIFEKSLKASTIKNDYKIGTPLDLYFETNAFKVYEIDENGWIISDKESMILKTKMEKEGIPLKDWNIDISIGILNGFNEAYLISTEKRNELIKLNPKCNQIIKPILRGRDLKKYSYKWDELWLINSHNGIKSLGINRINVENDFPEIYQHLLAYKHELEIRQNKGDHWTNLRNCAYFLEFEKPKIIWGELSDVPKFAFDENGMYAEATLFAMTGNNLKFLLAVLNSRIGLWYFNQITTTSGMGTSRWKKYKIEQFPIKAISTDKMKPFEELVDKIISMKNNSLDSTKWENKIDALVFHLYELTEEEILYILNTFEDLSMKDKNAIHNEYRNIKNNNFKLEI